MSKVIYPMNATMTPLDFPDKTALIAYMNEEHGDDLMMFTQAWFSKNYPTAQTVLLTDIAQEGLSLLIYPPSTKDTSPGAVFLAFFTPISHADAFQPQYIALVQQAAKKLGKRAITLTMPDFILLDSYQVTSHMLRLVLATQTDLSEVDAGYAYLFDITSDRRAMPSSPALIDESDADIATNKRAVRYYTLRKAWRACDQWHAWVDVFLHTDDTGHLSAGASWALSLKAGDTITTTRGFPEKTAHLATGQALLIADETSLPTLARLLEQWQNPLPPLVLLITQQASEHTYLTAIEWQKLKGENITILPLTLADFASNTPMTMCEPIMATLNAYLIHNPLTIDCVWGGLEASLTKQLRPKLCEQFGLSRDVMVLKVYWRSMA